MNARYISKDVLPQCTTQDVSTSCRQYCQTATLVESSACNSYPPSTHWYNKQWLNHVQPS